MVDGLKNSVAQVDCVPDEGEVGSATNFYGNGFHTEKTIYKTAKEAVSHYDAAKSRAWVIQNPSKTNYVGNPVGYKICESAGRHIGALLTCSEQGHAASAGQAGVARLEQGPLRSGKREWHWSFAHSAYISSPFPPPTIHPFFFCVVPC